MRPVNFEDAIRELARSGALALADWPDGEPLGDYGLSIRDGRVVPDGGHDPLQAVEIRRALAPGARTWLERLAVHPVIGSTNAELMTLATRQAVGGQVCTAELQVQGRGRRGRTWASPFGANLAVSLGLTVTRPVAELGGASLVVGLAVLDALETVGTPGLSLKWPNDVLRDGAKLAGILIEMSRTHGTELVVGIGLNVALTPTLRSRLPQAVADLSDLPQRPSRNELLAGIVSSVVTFVSEFDRLGFEPFIEAFNDRHFYHGLDSRVVQGQGSVDGRVAGVSASGELILAGPAGLQTFNGGEVSLRQAQ